MRVSPLLSLVPFVFIAFSAAGIVLITLGIRGRPIFAAPRCRRCGYDLRNVNFTSDDVGNCPECGTPLATPEAVTFGKWRRQPKKIVWGAVLAAVPWLLGFATMFYFRSQGNVAVAGPGALASQSNAALVASLPANANAPWHWQELERRLKANQLTQADVDGVFTALATQLNADRAAGKSRQPLHWAGNFLTPALASRNFSQGKLDALCQAYYRMAPAMKVRDRARAGKPIHLVLNEHEPWDISGLQRCWALADVTLDGAKLSLKHRYNEKAGLKPDQLSGTGRDGELQLALPEPLSAGEHELIFTYDVGIVPEAATFRGLDGKPGTADKWPPTVARWQAVVKHKLTVTPADQSPLAIVTDPERDPFRTAKVTVEEALVRPATDGVELAIRWKLTATDIQPAASFRIVVQAGAEQIDFGRMVFGSTGRGSTRSMSDRKRLKSFPANVQAIDVTLKPDPVPAEDFIEFKEVWGQPIELKDIPLQRFDGESPK